MLQRSSKHENTSATVAERLRKRTPLTHLANGSNQLRSTSTNIQQSTDRIATTTGKPIAPRQRMRPNDEANQSHRDHTQRFSPVDERSSSSHRERNASYSSAIPEFRSVLESESDAQSSSAYTVKQRQIELDRSSAGDSGGRERIEFSSATFESGMSLREGISVVQYDSY